jgi:hypothetical protein
MAAGGMLPVPLECQWQCRVRSHKPQARGRSSFFSRDRDIAEYYPLWETTRVAGRSIIPSNGPGDAATRTRNLSSPLSGTAPGSAVLRMVLFLMLASEGGHQCGGAVPSADSESFQFCQ